MKNFYILLFSIFTFAFGFAQTDAASHNITITDNGGGRLSIVYNGNADSYSFFGPGEGNPIYVYTWINASDNSTGNAYNDAWPLVPAIQLNYDADTDTFVGQVDLAEHNFTGEGGVLPTGTVVSRLGFLFRNADGSQQSTDTFQIFSPGITITTLGVQNSDLLKKSIVVSGKLRTQLQGNLSIKIYDYSGIIVKDFKVKAQGQAIELNLPKKGFYIMSLSNGQTVENLKFSY